MALNRKVFTVNREGVTVKFLQGFPTISEIVHINESLRIWLIIDERSPGGRERQRTNDIDRLQQRMRIFGDFFFGVGGSFHSAAGILNTPFFQATAADSTWLQNGEPNKIEKSMKILAGQKKKKLPKMVTHSFESPIIQVQSSQVTAHTQSI